MVIFDDKKINFIFLVEYQIALFKYLSLKWYGA